MKPSSAARVHRLENAADNLALIVLLKPYVAARTIRGNHRVGGVDTMPYASGVFLGCNMPRN